MRIRYSPILSIFLTPLGMPIPGMLGVTTYGLIGLATAASTVSPLLKTIGFHLTRYAIVLLGCKPSSYGPGWTIGSPGEALFEFAIT